MFGVAGKQLSTVASGERAQGGSPLPNRACPGADGKRWFRETRRFAGNASYSFLRSAWEQAIVPLRGNCATRSVPAVCSHAERRNEA